MPDYFIGRSLTDVGVLGDPINLALDGSEAQLHAASWASLRSSWIPRDIGEDPCSPSQLLYPTDAALCRRPQPPFDAK